jgi:hypothetical protein
MESYTIKEAWENACKEEGIPVDSKFVVFSESNTWAKKYDKAVRLYFAARAASLQLAS